MEVVGGGVVVREKRGERRAISLLKTGEWETGFWISLSFCKIKIRLLVLFDRRKIIVG